MTRLDSPAARADAQVLSLLDEVIRGTRKFEQVARLEGQIEREYRGRVLYELLQNAHDALPLPGVRASRRVRFVLEVDGGQPALLAANDGAPLTPENVRGLSEIAMSTKDPATAIGNKGIGFRSVLSVSDAPQIYSRNPSASPNSAFSGHCFAFDPQATQTVHAAVSAFLEGEVARSPFSELPLVPHGEADSLRARLLDVEHETPGAVAHAVATLSPYALPSPAPAPSPAVERLAAQGYATVVRLPLRLDVDLNSLHEQLETLCAPETLLFLDRVERLEVSVDGAETALVRAEDGPAPAGGRSLVITSHANGEAVEHGFWTWSRVVGEGSTEAAALACAIAESDLPTAWQAITTARVGVAVEAVPRPRAGRYGIFLPTRLPSGSGAFLNAPFSGSLNRDRLDATLPLNALLLDALAGECARVVQALGDADPADATTSAVRLALVAPHGHVPFGVPNAAALTREALGADGIASLPVVATNQGWATPGAARVVEGMSGRSLLTPLVLQRSSPFPVVAAHLAGPFRLLADALETQAAPTDDEHAQIVAAAVAAVAAPDVDWVDLLTDVRALVPNVHHLEHAPFLPAGDGRLVSPAGPPRLFFPPEQSRDLQDVPDVLRDQVVFLSPRVQLREGGISGRPQTTARTYLSVVSEFKGEDLLRDVVADAIPETPTALGSDEARRWASILPWAARLLTGDAPDAVSRSFPVPCRGGWYPAGTASYGSGWDDSDAGLGRDVGFYLQAARKAGSSTAAAALRRVVLPATHSAWGGHEPSRQLLDRLGVTPGLRLVSCPWPETVDVRRTRASMPPEAPEGISAAQWEVVSPRLRDALTAACDFKNSTPYTFSEVWTVPGLDAFAGFGAETTWRLGRLVAASLASWPDASDDQFRATNVRAAAAPSSWRRLAARRVGPRAPMLLVESPLAVLLRTLPWLSDGPRAAAPSRWWLLPQRWTDDLDQRRYDYLWPVPRPIARAPAMANALVYLGAGRLADEPASPDAARFLDAVADGLENGVPEPDVVAHLRAGWDHLDRDVSWPRRLVVRRGERLVVAEHDAAGETPPVFFPNGDESTAAILRRHDHPVVLVDARAARRLAADAPAWGSTSGQLTRTSDVSPSILVDGDPWTLERAADAVPTRLGWLAEVALAAHAFCAGGRGADTDSFARATATMHRARIVRVERLETSLAVGDHVLSPPVSVGAHWHRPSSRLIVAHAAPLADLVEPLLAMIGRSDPEVALRFALESLGSATGASPPDDAAVAHALSKLNVDAGHLAEVRRALLGDLEITRGHALTVAALLDPSAAATVAAASSEHKLRAALEALSPEEGLWELCQSAGDDAALGRALWTRLGDGADLAAWNAALLKTGCRPVGSESATASADATLRAALPLARAVLRHELLKQDRIGDYGPLAQGLGGVEADPGLHLTHWEPPFSVAVCPLADALHLAGVGGAGAEALSRAPGADDARQALVTLGVDPSDPDEMRDENARRGAQASDTLAHIDAALHHASGSPRTLFERFEIGVQRALGALGVSHRWSPDDALRLVASHAQTDGLENPLLAAAAAAPSLDALLDRLGVTTEQVEAARSEMRDQERKAQVSKTLVQVGSRGFDASGVGRDDLWKRRLWNHLEAVFPEESLPPADLATVTALGRAPEARRSRPRGQGEPGDAAPGRKRTSQTQRDLVGAVGEMIVFRALQRQYGSDVVPPSAWLSKARATVYPGSGTDSAGCDIAFDYQGVRYLVEVKSTTGDDGSFEMGSSEVDAALAAARPKSRQVYQIARVERALSDPAILFLPNPYGRSATSLYRVDPRGAYVSFRRA